jgi:tripeptidyl-peptidase I
MNKVPGNNKVGLTNNLTDTSNRSDVLISQETFRLEEASAASTFKTVVVAGGVDRQSQRSLEQLDAGLELEGNFWMPRPSPALSNPTRLTTFNTGGSLSFMSDANTPENTNEPSLFWLQYVLGQSDTEVLKVISTSYADDEQTVPP